jgi:hypothetical protein
VPSRKSTLGSYYIQPRHSLDRVLYTATSPYLLLYTATIQSIFENVCRVVAPCHVYTAIYIYTAIYTAIYITQPYTATVQSTFENVCRVVAPCHAHKARKPCVADRDLKCIDFFIWRPSKVSLPRKAKPNVIVRDEIDHDPLSRTLKTQWSLTYILTYIYHIKCIFTT